MSIKDFECSYLIHTFMNTPLILKPAFCITSSMTYTSKIYKPRILCYLMSTLHTPTIQYTCLPPIIHHILSINPHTSTRYPSKLITMHALHKTNRSSSYLVFVGQTQTCHRPRDSVGGSRVGTTWSWNAHQGPRPSSPPQSKNYPLPWIFCSPY